MTFACVRRFEKAPSWICRAVVRAADLDVCSRFASYQIGPSSYRNILSTPGSDTQPPSNSGKKQSETLVREYVSARTRFRANGNLADSSFVSSAEVLSPTRARCLTRFSYAGVRHALDERHPLQPRKPSPWPYVRHPKDHSCCGSYPPREAKVHLPGKPRCQAVRVRKRTQGFHKRI